MDKETNTISFPINFCNIIKSVDKLINMVFPDIQSNYKNRKWLRERAVLSAKNACVNKMNQKILHMIPGKISHINQSNRIES